MRFRGSRRRDDDPWPGRNWQLLLERDRIPYLNDNFFPFITLLFIELFLLLVLQAGHR